MDNSDCDGCDECKDHSCVTVEPECTSHLECNAGLTGVCDGLMTQCMYCDVDDNNTCNNKCTPGTNIFCIKYMIKFSRMC